MNRLDFLVDGTAGHNEDPLTARFPRTTREAFGPYAGNSGLPQRITFMPCQRGCWRGVAFIAALILVGLVVAGAQS